MIVQVDFVRHELVRSILARHVRLEVAMLSSEYRYRFSRVLRLKSPDIHPRLWSWTWLWCGTV